MKVSSSDCVRILRLFHQASETIVPRDIERLSVSRPNEVSTLATFRLGKQTFAILFDDVIADATEAVASAIQLTQPNTPVELIANPTQSDESYGMPYEGKVCYLANLGDDKQRLDIYLATTYPEYSRSSWQKFIKNGYVAVDKTIQKAPKYLVSDPSKITIHLPGAPDHSDKELPIIYLDEDVIVINKPAGVLTHSKNQLDREFTVADFFRRYTTVGLDADRPGIVHRLDRDTSGVMIGARHQKAYEHLKEQFADRLAHKTYEAVVDGVPSAPELVIDLPIARNPAAPGSFKVDPKGKSAQTKLAVIDTNSRHTLVKLEPLTGRTHQLRVHMAYLHTPIHGDRLYGKIADRLYLHAAKLQLVLPSGTTTEFKADRPKQFDALVRS